MTLRRSESTRRGPIPAQIPALSARGLRVALDGVEVLHGIDLDLPAGRWTAVVGANGAGKTTLLKALAGLVPAAGSVELLGQAQRPARERARLLAWMGQAQAAGGDLLAADVVMLGRLPHQHWLGGPTPADHAAVETAMRETQCWDWRDRALGSLSGGERQRVLLARALAVQAQVLLMDEPLANLDPPHQADWLATVRGLVARGGTVVSVLHEVTMALQADELLILREGRLAHQGAAAARATHAALEAAFAHRIEVHSLGGRLVALPC